jgi:hypothetical protein
MGGSMGSTSCPRVHRSPASYWACEPWAVGKPLGSWPMGRCCTASGPGVASKPSWVWSRWGSMGEREQRTWASAAERSGRVVAGGRPWLLGGSRTWELGSWPEHASWDPLCESDNCRTEVLSKVTSVLFRLGIKYIRRGSIQFDRAVSSRLSGRRVA